MAEGKGNRYSTGETIETIFEDETAMMKVLIVDMIKILFLIVKMKGQ